MKTPTEIAASLESLNEWRRKFEFLATKMPDPYELGGDIYRAVTLLRELATITAERDQLRAALADPQQLHAHCLRTLNEGQIAHVLGQQMTTICAELHQLRSDCDNETKWAAHYLAHSIADKARADKAEAELATERARLDWLLSYDGVDWILSAHKNRKLFEGESDNRALLEAAMQEDVK